LAPYNAGFDPNIKPTPYNPEKAKALLKAAGYPKGFDTTITTSPAAKTETEAIAASLRKVGIRAKVIAPEAGIWARSVMGKKARGLGRHPGPWWVGRSHPAVALESHLSSKSPWTFHVTPEIDAALVDLGNFMDQKEVSARAKALSKMYRETLIRAPLWTQNVPYGLGPRVKYWEPVSGWVFMAGLEFLELKE
jgi:peptide/nickel transport system substrate-binding protein